MKKWEYEYVKVPESSVVSKNRLNELGKDGWELVAIMTLPHGNIFYLKKECKEEVDISKGMD